MFGFKPVLDLADRITQSFVSKYKSNYCQTKVTDDKLVEWYRHKNNLTSIPRNDLHLIEDITVSEALQTVNLSH